MRRRLALALGLLTATLAPLGLRAPEATALPVLCDWPVYIGKDGANVLAPDYQANYWILHYTNVPGTTLRIDGTYPDAQFFSHTLQDEATITTAALVDSEIVPDEPGTNPYASKGAAFGANYSIRIDPGTEPAAGPAPNTLYAGQTFEGEPNPGGTLIYRVYVSTDQSDPLAGQPLPTVVWETPGGDVDLTVEQCSPAGSGLGGPLNEQTYDADRPVGVPGLVPASGDYHEVPDFVRLHSGQFTDPVLNSLPGALTDPLPHRGGVPLANKPFPYLRSSITRQLGELVVVRFKVPTFPDTIAGESVTRRTQVRYLSLCSYAAQEDGGLRGNDCRTDFEMRPDRRGFVTYVVSDPAHRPTADSLDVPGVDTLPWGPWDKDFLLFRVGIPREGWRYSPLGVGPEAEDQVAAARAAMGPYYPVARYCTAEVIETDGVDACF